MSGPAPADEAHDSAPQSEAQPGAESASDPSLAPPLDDPAPVPDATPPAPPAPSVALEWRTIKPYFGLLDFSKTPDTKVGWGIRFAVLSVVLVTLWKRIEIATFPMLTARRAAPIPTEEIDDYRFRIPEHTRREMFLQLATAELAERERAIKANTWNGHLWSREDDRGHYERVAVRAVAAKYHVSLSQTYLVLDEGLRNHWPAPDGKPLPVTTPPFSIRTNSW